MSFSVPISKDIFKLPAQTFHQDELTRVTGLSLAPVEPEHAQAITETISTETFQTSGTFGPQSKRTVVPSGNWPSVTSPPRSFNGEFDCETESPLISLVHVISEVSLVELSNDNSSNASSDSEVQFDLFDFLAPDPSLSRSDPTYSNLLISPANKSHHKDSSPISRAFRSASDLASEALCIQIDELQPESGQILQYRTPCATFSTLPSPIFAPPSPSSDSTPRTLTPSNSFSFLRRKFWQRSPDRDRFIEGRADMEERSPSPLSLNFSSYDIITPISAPSSPAFSTAPVRPTSRLSERSLASTNSVSLLYPCVPQSISRQYSEPSQLEHLPETISWLQDIHPELWFDQEGFRATRATFKLVGYSHSDRSFVPFGLETQDLAIKPVSNLHSGIADFVPVKRQVFIFHRSALDSPPVLRRLTANDDESRDYISRQASLTLKNGVYTVRGRESTTPPSPISVHGNGDNIFISEKGSAAKFKWRFDYMVQDRRAEATGKIMAGEKTFTPLAFSCSPWMLHPLQAKKVKLMHIVKKSVATKITAEKIEPPRPPIPNHAPLSLSIVTNAPLASLALQPAKAHTSKLHRRARSHAIDENTPSPLLISPLDTKPAEHQWTTRPIRRRRASSAGEHSLVNYLVTGREMVQSRGPTAIQQHIVPPRELAQMMISNNTEPNTNAKRRPGFTPLNPPGYHRRIRPPTERAQT